MAGTTARHRPTASGMRLLALAALLILTAWYFLAINPIPAQHATQALPAPATSPASAAEPALPTDQSPATPPGHPAPASTALAASPEPSAGSPRCAPNALTIPDLSINAPVVQIGLDAQGNLGAPSDADKKKVGWFPSTLAGAARGSVILTGHTYHDDTALFRTDFSRTAHLGMAVQLSCPGAQPLAYRVTEAKLDLGIENYATYVDSHQLYATDGPPQVVIITCTDWNPIRRDYDQRGILIATPLP